jgi:hypothetical protein
MTEDEYEDALAERYRATIGARPTPEEVAQVLADGSADYGMAYTPDDQMPTEPMPQEMSDAFDRQDVQQESTIHVGEDPVLRIRRRTPSEMLEYVASRIELDEEHYKPYQLVMLLRMIAEQVADA